MTDTNDNVGVPRTYGHLPACVRLEMLVGLLSDQLYSSRELAAALRLQVNASVTTHGELEHLCDLTGSLWKRLGDIAEEVRALRALHEAGV